jgi:hypothetical protein
VCADVSPKDFALRFPGNDRSSMGEQRLRQAEMVRLDAGRNLGLVRVVAHRP